MVESKAIGIWKIIVLIGVVLLTLGLIAFAIDQVSTGRFDFIDGHDGIFGLALLIGLICLLVGLISLARLLNKAGRSRVAKFAIMLPIVVLVIAGYSIPNTMDGVFPLFGISMTTVMLVGFVIAIMAAKARG